MPKGINAGYKSSGGRPYTGGKDVSSRRTRMKSKYGLSLDDYDRIFSNQSGCCCICNKPERATVYGVVKRLAVDHCHKTGKIRGLLCNSCNALLAKINDNVDWLEAAITYLKK